VLVILKNHVADNHRVVHHRFGVFQKIHLLVPHRLLVVGGYPTTDLICDTGGIWMRKLFSVCRTTSGSPLANCTIDVPCENNGMMSQKLASPTGPCSSRTAHRHVTVDHCIIVTGEWVTKIDKLYTNSIFRNRRKGSWL